MAVAVRKITTWPVVLVSGISSLILAFVILVLTPNLGLNLVSITFGADLAFTGFSLLLISIMGFFGKGQYSAGLTVVADDGYTCILWTDCFS